ncbi:unnamed protein product [Owenia fusiformis]|uniref:Uncharacterized protein n=1 Tax=Owenia fusiformis TaxID=6347 RepID=A0A8J1XG18_OWEFU|nr:unnamed protein product [Owenia fusiformis]
MTMSNGSEYVVYPPGAGSYYFHNTSTIPPSPMEVTNVTLEMTGISQRYSTPALIVVSIILGGVTLGTAFGNILVLVALYKFKNLKTVSNYLIGNLAISDLLLALTVLPMSATNDILGYWVFGRVLCSVWLSIDVFYCTASIWSLCVVAIDRYTATNFPVWYRERRSIQRALLYITMVWIFSIAISIAPFFGWNNTIEENVRRDVYGKERCILFEKVDYVVYSASGSFIIPLFLMMFLYFRIFYVIRSRARQLRRSLDKHAKKDKAARELSGGPKAELPPSTPQKDMHLLNKHLIQIDVNSTFDGVSTQSYFSSDPSSSSQEKSEDSTHGTSLKRDSTERTISEKTDPNSLKNGIDHEKQMLIPVITCTPAEEDVNSNETDNTKVEACTNGTQVPTTGNNNEPPVTTTKKTKPKMNKQEVEKTKKKRKQFRSNSHQRKFDQREQRATKRMAIIMACFIFCWLPFFTMYLTNSLCGATCVINADIASVIIWLGYVNSTLNPVLYTVFNEEFRRAFYKLLCTSRS